MSYKTLFVAALAASPFAAQAQQLDCGNQLIDRGNTVDELLAACGEPSAKDGDVWIYTRDNRLTVLVTVRNGRVERITDADS